jgi:hypothetical protein
MIDGLRRRFRGPTAADRWDADQLLSPGREGTTALPADAPVLVVANDGSGHYAPDDASTPDYYRSIVRTALANGGRYGGHRIPVPWLQMILAGLESRHIDPEMTWYMAERGEGAGESLEDVPSYGDLFPTDGTRSSGPAGRL